LPLELGHSNARGVCSQDEGRHFGRGTKSLRCCLRRVFGRKRKSRRHEAAGRRNSPDAVPNEKGGMETMYELRRTVFWETGSTIHTGHSQSTRIACWWTKDEQSTVHHIVGMALRDAANGSASHLSRIVGSRRGEAKGNTARTAGTRRFDFAWEAGHFLGADSARDWGELPERPTLSRTCNREASLTRGILRSAEE
jgi:hypothetical protein